jgi:hypothetical protein
MRSWLLALVAIVSSAAAAVAQGDKETDDLKPADPDTGESTVAEETLGLLPNPFEKQGIKFAVTYIGEALGNATGGAKQSAVYEERINFAADVDLEKLVGLRQLTFHAIHGRVYQRFVRLPGRVVTRYASRRSIAAPCRHDVMVEGSKLKGLQIGKSPER